LAFRGKGGVFRARIGQPLEDMHQRISREFDPDNGRIWYYGGSIPHISLEGKKAATRGKTTSETACSVVRALEKNRRGGQRRESVPVRKLKKIVNLEIEILMGKKRGLIVGARMGERCQQSLTRTVVL